MRAVAGGDSGQWRILSVLRRQSIVADDCLPRSSLRLGGKRRSGAIRVPGRQPLCSRHLRRFSRSPRRITCAPLIDQRAVLLITSSDRACTLFCTLMLPASTTVIEPVTVLLVLPLPDRTEELHHIHLLGPHLNHPWVLAHTPRRGAARTFFLETTHHSVSTVASH